MLSREEGPSPSRSRDLPLLLNANLGFGSLQSGGMGGGGGGGRMRAGAKVGVSRSLPFLVRNCPDYWRVKAESKMVTPVEELVARLQGR